MPRGCILARTWPKPPYLLRIYKLNVTLSGTAASFNEVIGLFR